MATNPTRLDTGGSGCLWEEPATHLGTESSPRSDFSGLQRMVMTELRPWSHDAVACRDLWANGDFYQLGTQIWRPSSVLDL